MDIFHCHFIILEVHMPDDIAHFALKKFNFIMVVVSPILMTCPQVAQAEHIHGHAHTVPCILVWLIKLLQTSGCLFLTQPFLGPHHHAIISTM